MRNMKGPNPDDRFMLRVPTGLHVDFTNNIELAKQLELQEAAKTNPTQESFGADRKRLFSTHQDMLRGGADMANLEDLGRKLVDCDMEFGVGGLESINVKALNKFGGAMSEAEFEEATAGSK